MAVLKLSQIAAAGSAPALTDTVIGVSSGTTDEQFTLAQIQSTVSPAAANPTATAGPVAINGTATTFMRSDAAPAIQKASASQFGIVEVDGTTITAVGGVISSANSGAPGGSVNDIQYNNGSGGFAGASNFTIDGGGNPNVASGHSYDYGGNFFIGFDSHNNIDLGQGAGNFGTPSGGGFNISIGISAGGGITTALLNTFIGYQAGQSVTTGSENVIMGSNYHGTAAMQNTVILTDGGGNLLFLVEQTGNETVIVGQGGNYPTATGSLNMAMGPSALANLTSGFQNVGLSISAGQHITTGSQNLAIGTGAMQTLTDGTLNVAIGAEAMGSGGAGGTSDHANNCLAIGAGALTFYSSPSQIVAIGPSALLGNSASVSGANHVAIGYHSMFAGDGAGDGNTAVGSQTLQNLASGNQNTAIGKFALQAQTANSFNVGIGYLAGYQITTGDTNICIGTNSGTGLTTGRGNTIIGGATVAAGLANAIVLADGDGNIKLDYNNTNSSKWTLAGSLVIPALSTAGILVNNSSGNVSSNSTVAAATVAANFTADHRLQITIGSTTYYIPLSTTAW